MSTKYIRVKISKLEDFPVEDTDPKDKQATAALEQAISKYPGFDVWLDEEPRRF